MTREELLQNAKPILFNTEMVRAILSGRKTVTRRVMKPQPTLKDGFWTFAGAGWSDGINQITPMPCHSLYNKAPYHPGDILYVRETWSEVETVDGKPHYVYKADDNGEYYSNLYSSRENFKRWYPSIHMPRDAVRIFLRVTDVRVERLQDMCGGDLLKEGIDIYPCKMKDAFGKFKELWDSTIKKSDLDAYGWNANPWVWVIEFERLEVETV